jgi:pyruvate,water dikinase
MLARALEADAEDSEQRLSLVRVDADRDLASLEANLSYFEATLLRGLITRNRNLLRLRERMRSGLARTMAMIRRVVLDVDRRLRRLDPSTFAGAAFFFNLGELSSAVGHLRADLGPVARWRRAGWERLCGEPDPPEIFVGMPPPIGPFIEPTLRGEAASPGLVSGPVRVVDLDDLARRMPRPGEILVLRSLDVGLSPLMLRAAGLVAECGGTLSHGAVLARELGLPAVVGVPGARSLLKDGQLVHLDGGAGVIERAAK